jgi:pimeloyl-[acyl-carrier protein] methyl ester esterase
MVTNLSPKIEINFMHGWGFGGEVWQDWAMPSLGEVTYNKLERGYFGHAKMNCEPIPHRPRILIVHSFGLHIAPKELFTKIDLLVIISSFGTFLSNAEDNRAKKRSLAAMQRKFLKAPEEVLADFYGACGIKSEKYSPLIKFDNVNLPLLEADLHLLGTSSFDLNMLSLIPRILLLHGENDSIVNLSQSEDMQRKLSNSHLFAIPEGEHALPILQSVECKIFVESMINSILQPIRI